MRWLPRLSMRLGAKGRASQSLAMRIELPFTAGEVERGLLFRPLDYNQWIDPEIQRGEITAHPNWPYEGQVAYEYPSQTRWFPPFAKSNRGFIRVQDWVKGRSCTLVDETQPHSVLSVHKFRYEDSPGGCVLEIEHSSAVRGWFASRLLGWAILAVIPIEAAKSTCEFARMLEISPVGTTLHRTAADAPVFQ